jgi:4-aminobutyrate aminotransferase
MVTNIIVAPFPYSSQLPRCTHASAQARSDYCIEAIELLLKQQSAASETAAILLEPILGEGGYVVPPDGFLHALRTLCDRHKILLICDEVQSGCGRTGRMWAVQHWDIVPDILIMAKGIASGYPLSGIAANRAVLSLTPLLCIF